MPVSDRCRMAGHVMNVCRLNPRSPGSTARFEALRSELLQKYVIRVSQVEACWEVSHPDIRTYHCKNRLQIGFAVCELLRRLGPST